MKPLIRMMLVLAVIVCASALVAEEGKTLMILKVVPKDNGKPIAGLPVTVTQMSTGKSQTNATLKGGAAWFSMWGSHKGTKSLYKVETTYGDRYFGKSGSCPPGKDCVTADVYIDFMPNDEIRTKVVKSGESDLCTCRFILEPAYRPGLTYQLIETTDGKKTVMLDMCPCEWGLEFKLWKPSSWIFRVFENGAQVGEQKFTIEKNRTHMNIHVKIDGPSAGSVSSSGGM